MARVGRLAGAILAETNGEWLLVGNTKKPCAWEAAGFEPPVEIDAMKRPYVHLAQCGPATIAPPVLTIDVEGEELAQRLAALFLIERNGSVSDRLWRLVVNPDDLLDDHDIPSSVDARWLGGIPLPVWNVVRETVLRCV
jgi:hypothetical protein